MLNRQRQLQILLLHLGAFLIPLFPARVVDRSLQLALAPGNRPRNQGTYKQRLPKLPSHFDEVPLEQHQTQTDQDQSYQHSPHRRPQHRGVPVQTHEQKGPNHSCRSRHNRKGIANPCHSGTVAVSKEKQSRDDLLTRRTRVAAERHRLGAVATVHLFDPQTLYRHWEDGQWSPFAIDLDADREQWRELGGEDRGLIFWVLSSLMVAEERITTKFSGLVGAYGSEEEATFLATQQVDEARHMQFYARFQDEVVADPAAIAAHVARAREQISPAFRLIFDEALVAAHRELVANPGSAEAKVRFVTLYHQVLEGTLGLTSFNFVTAYLERESLLPGFVAGYSKIHHDEQRHIGYGTWYLREAVAAEPALADVVRATLRELLPAVAESLTPPDREGTDWDALGAGAEEIREFALGGLTRRLSLIGVPLSSL